MKTVTFTEFRRNASGLLSDVEQGESLVVIRHGKPIAEISPVSSSLGAPRWKQPALRLSAKGANLADAIIRERSYEDVL